LTTNVLQLAVAFSQLPHSVSLDRHTTMQLRSASACKVDASMADTALTTPVESSPSHDAAITSRIVYSKKRLFNDGAIVFTQDHIELLESLGRQVDDIRTEAFTEIDRFDHRLDKCERQMLGVHIALNACQKERPEFVVGTENTPIGHGADAQHLELSNRLHAVESDVMVIRQDIDSMTDVLHSMRAHSATQWQLLSVQLKDMQRCFVAFEERMARMEREMLDADTTSQSDA
jgi:hypothetical protein